MTENDEWQAGTWEGSRRAQLRRALRLSVRERLEGLEALKEASDRLASIGARNRQQSSVEQLEKNETE